METPPAKNIAFYQFLKLKQVIDATSLGRSQIYALMAETPPKFPKPVRLSGGRVAWIGGEIDGWKMARVAERDGAAK